MALTVVALFTVSCNTHKHASTFQEEVEESTMFFEPEQQPYYLHGGNDGLLRDLYSAMSETAPITEDSVSGRAVVKIKITKEGTIDPNSIDVFRNQSVPADYLNAAIEAIKNLGKFEPGKMNGTPLTVTYYLTIKYPIPSDLINTSE